MVVFLFVIGCLKDWSMDSDLGMYVDNKFLWVIVGFNGYIIKKLVVLFKMGYGNSNYESGSDYEYVIG